MTPLRLNLASGTDIRDGWVNLDVVARWPIAARGCDVVWDARKDRLPFPDGSVDEVYAGYLFLHLAPQHHKRVLEDIHRVMKANAPLILSDVEMDKVLLRWLESPTDPRLCELIWGEQGDVHGMDLAEFDKHCHGFTEDTLREFLQGGGFKVVGRGRYHPPEVWYDLSMAALKP